MYEDKFNFHKSQLNLSCLWEKKNDKVNSPWKDILLQKAKSMFSLKKKHPVTRRQEDSVDPWKMHGHNSVIVHEEGGA